MRKGFLRGAAAVLAAAFMMAVCTGAQTTAQLPKAYWPLQTAYEKALAAKTPEAVAKTGQAILDLFVGKEDPAQKAAALLAKKGIEINIVYSVALNVLDAYEAMGDDAAALKTILVAQPFTVAWQEFTGKYEESTIAMLASKRAFYDVPVSVYAEVPGAGGDISFHNAKFEPKNGVLFGEAVASADKSSGAFKNSSAGLVYVLFETETVAQFDYLIAPMIKAGQTVEVAWNLKNEGQSLAGVLKERAKIEQAAAYLAGLKAPVWLRFGAEMNVWDKPADPKQFIEAFRLVADIMHKNAPNVAVLWSPNSIGEQGKTYEMFYPGDEYVDWVGISLYTTRYFLGDKDQSLLAQSIYFTGKFANPVALIAPLVKAYGDKKPIIVSEGGVENYSLTNKTDETAFAEKQMRVMYAALPVVYPQVKAMLYFNTIFGAPASRFTLYDNAAINKLYGELTASPYFIKPGKQAADVSYKKLGDVTLAADKVPLLVYAPYLSKQNVSVTYKLDGKWIGAGSAVPYKQTFNLSAAADGAHTLTVEVAGDGKLLKAVTLYANKSGKNVTLSDRQPK